MKAEWYGDPRDLVKWAVLLHIADRFSCNHILQVLYLQSTKWGKIRIGDSEISLNQAVIDHFRSPSNVSNLDCNVVIETLHEKELRDHGEYLQFVLNRISQRTKHPSVIFLDPDTGLEPSKSKPRLEHVRAIDLQKIWDRCVSGDVLVLYQHAFRSKNWLEEKKRQFEEVLGLSSDKVEYGYAPEFKGAKDVAFLFAHK